MSAILPKIGEEVRLHAGWQNLFLARDSEAVADKILQCLGKLAA